MEFFSTKKSIFLHISSMFKSIFFFCLRFNSVVVKRIKSIHLFFLNPLMCFFLWSFKFSRFCQFQYRISIYHHYITTMTRSLNTNHEKGQNWKKKAPWKNVFGLQKVGKMYTNPGRHTVHSVIPNNCCLLPYPKGD